jgi:hypothetical protein
MERAHTERIHHSCGADRAHATNKNVHSIDFDGVEKILTTEF